MCCMCGMDEDIPTKELDGCFFCEACFPKAKLDLTKFQSKNQEDK